MIIDADTHVFPVDAFDYMDPKFNDIKPRVVFSATGLIEDIDFPGDHVVPGATPLPSPGAGRSHSGLCNIEKRIQDHAKLGIDQELLMPQFGALRLHYALDADLASDMAHSYNLAVLKLKHQYPDKFLVAAVVALQDVSGAICEMEWAKNNGFSAVVIDKVYPVRDHPYSETLGSHRELWPFWQRAQELDMPIWLHSIQHGHRISNLPIYQHAGTDVAAPSESHLSLISLCTSGVFDQFPKLKIVYTEAGSAFIKPLLKQFDRSQAATDYDSEDANYDLAKLPGDRMLRKGKRKTSLEQYYACHKLPLVDYFRRNIWFTIETEEPELVDSISFLGTDRFLFATDYPHDDPGGKMKWLDSKLLADHSGIDEDTKNRIRSENLKKLLAN